MRTALFGLSQKLILFTQTGWPRYAIYDRFFHGAAPQ